MSKWQIICMAGSSFTVQLEGENAVGIMRMQSNKKSFLTAFWKLEEDD